MIKDPSEQAKAEIHACLNPDSQSADTEKALRLREALRKPTKPLAQVLREIFTPEELRELRKVLSEDVQI